MWGMSKNDLFETLGHSHRFYSLTYQEVGDMLNMDHFDVSEIADVVDRGYLDGVSRVPREKVIERLKEKFQ